MDNDLIGAILKTFASDKDVKNAVVNYINASTEKIKVDDWIEVWQQQSDSPVVLEIAHDLTTGMKDVKRNLFGFSVAKYSRRERVGVMYGYANTGGGADYRWSYDHLKPICVFSITADEYTDVIRYAQSHWTDVLQALQDYVSKENETNGIKANANATK